MGIEEYVTRVEEFNSSKAKNKDNIKMELNYKIYSKQVKNMQKTRLNKTKEKVSKFGVKERGDEEEKRKDGEEGKKGIERSLNSQLKPVFQIKKPCDEVIKSRTQEKCLDDKLEALKASLAKMRESNQKIEDKNQKLRKVLNRKKRLTQITRNTMLTEIDSIGNFNTKRQQEGSNGMELITNRLDNEIHSYISWTENFRKASALFYELVSTEDAFDENNKNKK